jgi:NAD(P)-dependent dehydrogenase (short-subunit alcohol dehydrogenase family)
MRLLNKVIIVTGATAGIGGAIATACIREGAKVLVHGINEGEGKALVTKLGDNAKLCIADLFAANSPQLIVESAISHFGKIDGLVNNAALVERSTLDDETPESIERSLQVNLKAPFFLIQAAYEELVKNKGSVLNIGSVNAYAGESTLLAYSISKGAMQTMTRNLANAQGVNGVRVNQINPGWVLTEREDRDQVKKGLEPGWHQRLEREAIPSGAMTTSVQMGEAAIYWLSDESKPFTGSVVDLEQFSIIGRNPEKL